MLHYDMVSYNLEQGLQQGIDPLLVGASGALELTNVRHVKHGQWVKRYGTRAIPRGQQLFASLTSGAGLCTYRDRLALFDANGKLFQYSSAESGFRRRQGLPLVIAHERTIGAWAGAFGQYDHVLCNGYIVTVWTSQEEDPTFTRKDIWCQVFDEKTGATVFGPSRVYSDNVYQKHEGVRLTACNSLVILTWTPLGSNSIKAMRLDCSTVAAISSGFTAETFIATDVDGTYGTRSYDAIAAYDNATASTDYFYLAYFGGGLGILKLKRISASTLTANATNTAAFGFSWSQGISIGLHDCAEGLWGAISTLENGITNAVLVDRVNRATLVGTGWAYTSFGSSVTDDGGPMRMVTICRWSATQAVIGTSGDGTINPNGVNGEPGAAPPICLHHIVSSNTGVTVVNRTTMSQCGVLSRIFTVGSRFYQYVGFHSTSQPLWALLEVAAEDTNDVRGSALFHPTTQCVWAQGRAHTKTVIGGQIATPSQQPINVLARSSTWYEAMGPVVSGSMRTFTMHRLQADFDSERFAKSNCTMSRENVIDGGFVFDGARVHEYGFHHAPEPPRWNVFSGGAMVAGNYQVIQVFRWMDGAGNVVRSPPSVPVNITTLPFTGAVHLYQRGIGLTMKQRVPEADFTGLTKKAQRVFVETYRTIEGGDEFYLCATQDSGTEVSTLGIAGLWNTVPEDGAFDPYFADDTLSDTTLVSQGLGRLYTEGGRNAFYGCPSLRCFARTSTRLWGIAPDDETIWYSEQEVTGRIAGWHPTQIVKVADVLVGLASIQDSVFALGERNVYRIVGDGLTPNGQGQPPYVTQLNMPGCIAANSIVATESGVYYRDSTDTISVIGGGKNSSVGEAVRDVLSANPYTFDAVYWKEEAEVRWSVGPSKTSTTGVEVVYHTVRDAWSVNTYYDNDTATASRAIVSYALWKDPIETTTNGTLVLLTSAGQAYTVDRTTNLDDGTWVEQSAALAWLRGTTPQTLGRVGRGSIVGKFGSRCGVAMDVSFDYADTWETVATWRASELDDSFPTWVGTTQRLLLNVGRKMDAVRVRVRDLQPDVGPLSTGVGFALSDVSLELGFEQTNKMSHLGRLGAMGGRR